MRRHPGIAIGEVPGRHQHQRRVAFAIGAPAAQTACPCRSPAPSACHRRDGWRSPARARRAARARAVRETAFRRSPRGCLADRTTRRGCAAAVFGNPYQQPQPVLLGERAVVLVLLRQLLRWQHCDVFRQHHQLCSWRRQRADQDVVAIADRRPVHRWGRSSRSARIAMICRADCIVDGGQTDAQWRAGDRRLQAPHALAGACGQGDCHGGDDQQRTAHIVATPHQQCQRPRRQTQNRAGVQTRQSVRSTAAEAAHRLASQQGCPGCRPAATAPSTDRRSPLAADTPTRSSRCAGAARSGVRPSPPHTTVTRLRRWPSPPPATASQDGNTAGRAWRPRWWRSAPRRADRR